MPVERKEREVKKKPTGNCSVGKLAEACNKIQIEEVSASRENNTVAT